MSSATAKPRSVSCAQCRNVVVTYNDFLSSAAVAKRKATVLHQQNQRMSVRETQSRDLTAEGDKTTCFCLVSNNIAVTKTRGARRQVRFCSVWCFFQICAVGAGRSCQRILSGNVWLLLGTIFIVLSLSHIPCIDTRCEHPVHVIRQGPGLLQVPVHMLLR